MPDLDNTDEDDGYGAADPRAPADTPAPALAGPDIPAVDEKARRVKADLCVQTWLSQYARNSPLSRDTEVWNHLVGKLPHLVTLILRET